MRADLWLSAHVGLGTTMPTTWVQEHFHPGTAVPWYGVLVSLVYSSHFLVMPIVAVVLWISHHDHFRVWMNMVVALAVGGLATYLVFPMAPPWLAGAGGAFPGPTVGRFTSEGYDLVGLHLVNGLVSHGQHLANPVAAMPSLHVGYATLAVGFFWVGRTPWQKAMLACYPLAMAFSLLYGGEHYVIDELAGAAYALTVIAGWRYLRARRAAERAVPDERVGERRLNQPA